MKRTCFFILLVFIVNNVYSQNLNNLRVRHINTSPDTIKIDTLSIIPNSVKVYNVDEVLINDTLYFIDYHKSLIILNKHLQNKFDSISITFRVFPYDFSKKYFNKDYKKFYEIHDNNNEDYIYKYSYREDDDDFFGKDKLNKSGSISRGISFGNNQDVIVNSSLNLQLSGKISENLNILAAISDNNIPIQPDGTSQQIQEFDKVFIKIFNDKTELTVGDFEIKKPKGYFMTLYKKVQGGSYSSDFNLKNNKIKKINTSISGAVSKGKYARQVFNGQEGLQGPYKLHGNNNEQYIIVLAGTEKVYIDGKLLKRGLQNDYIIDYNIAELTFTPNQPITKDKRIVVEFEYSDKNYARFLVFSNNQVKTNNGKFWFNIFSETDSKNQPIDQELNDEQKRLLSKIGDNTNLAIVHNYDSIGFNNDMVLYKMIDTLSNEGVYYDSIFVHSTSSDSAFYRVRFSNVGENNGNYIHVISAANGRVFEWIAPENGEKKGSYEPIVLLITPKKKQMLTFGGEINLLNNTKADFEFGITENDINTFSSLDNNDNTGYAVKFKLVHDFPVKNNTKLNTSLNYQLTDKNFNPVERYRDAEFERDWNLVSETGNYQEQLVNLQLIYINKSFVSAKYDVDYFSKDNGYKGLKNNINSNFRKNGFLFKINGSYLNSENTINKTSFLRYFTEFSKTFPVIQVGVNYEQEDNQWILINSDSLLNNSFMFNKWGLFINNADTIKNKFFANYSNRKDYLPLNNKMIYTTLGEDYNFGVHFLKNTNNNIKTTVTYRKLAVFESSLIDNKSENSLVGRIEHSLRAFKGTFTTSTFYELGSGLEIKKEFSYLEVANGQGVYSWTDYNENNIKELNEFEIAKFQDKADYIRIFTPTNDYIKTYYNQFNQIIYLNPYRKWHNKRGMKKFISRFSERFAYRINRKISDDNFFVNSNPFQGAINDTSLISINTSVRNTISFNKTSPKYGIDYIIQKNQNKQLLLNGFDSRNNLLNSIKFRWNISVYFTLLNNMDIGNKNYMSEYFSSKNYDIIYKKNGTTFNYQPNQTLRFSLIYKITEKKNNSGNQKSTENNCGVEIKYNIIEKGNLAVKLNYLAIKYNEETNTFLAYEMLDGFNPGNNFTWEVLFQRNISNTLQLNFNYNGRLTKGNDTIHNGGVQLRAYF
ncbi:MAG: hypothetical protein KAT68_12235 [Bacteroidales bacterium]|nr:hypothetical protein [Bacteroidales bacterium]